MQFNCADAAGLRIRVIRLELVVERQKMITVYVWLTDNIVDSPQFSVSHRDGAACPEIKKCLFPCGEKIHLLFWIFRYDLQFPRDCLPLVDFIQNAMLWLQSGSAFPESQQAWTHNKPGDTHDGGCRTPGQGFIASLSRRIASCSTVWMLVVHHCFSIAVGITKNLSYCCLLIGLP